MKLLIQSSSTDVSSEDFETDVRVVYCDADLSQLGRVLIFLDVARKCIW